MVFHEQKNDITKEIELLEHRLGVLDFHGMIHMGDLVNGHGEFEGLSIVERRSIYNALYRFSTKINANYYTIIVDKHHSPNGRQLSRSISGEIESFINDKLSYFQQFDRIVIYYDGGQKPLNRILESTFLKMRYANQKVQFNHKEKKLFQVADMLTYVDKIIYKYKHKIKFTATESAFFSQKLVKYTILELAKHRIRQSK